MMLTEIASKNPDMYRPGDEAGVAGSPGCRPRRYFSGIRRRVLAGSQRGGVQIQAGTAEGSSGRELFARGVGRRLLTRLALILVYVAAAVPAGLFRGFADDF